MQPGQRTNRALVFALYLISGFLSLGCQVLWFRLFTDRYGATNLTFGLVVVNFIGGLGIGGWLSRRADRWLRGFSGIANPLRRYGLLELLVTAGLLLTVATQFWPLPPAGSDPYTGPHAIGEGLTVQRIAAGWKVAIAFVSVLVILVPCVFMGMTFPLLCAAFGEDGKFPATLYGWNTVGACAGILACEFVLLPRFGTFPTLIGLIAANALLGVAAWRGIAWRDPGVAGAGAEEAPRDVAREEGGGVVISWPTALFLAGVGGWLTGALEADLFQQIRFNGYVLSAAMAFVSFWAILAIALAAFAMPALPALNMGRIRAVAVAAFAIHWVTGLFRYELRDGIARWFLPWPLDATGGYIPHYFDAGLVPVFFYTGVRVFPPFFLIALLFPFACNQAQAARRHLGPLYATNTVAFCLGLLAFSMAAPRVNLFYALRLFPLLFAVTVAALFFWKAAQKHGRLKAGVALATAAVVCLLTPRSFNRDLFHPNTPPAGGEVRAMKSNGAHTTYVVTQPGGRGEMLWFDGHAMSGNSPEAQLYMRLMAHFPLLAQPDPKAALLIGFGVGNTASAIARHESIVRFDIVDLNANVLATAPEFAGTNERAYADPRVTRYHDDGRNFLRLTERKYDLITSEPPPPLHEGVFRLYSSEYYASVRGHLTPMGMMTQWLPMNQLTPEAADLITRTFVQAFPYCTVFIGQTEHLILVGSKSEIRLDSIERRWNPALDAVADLQRMGLRTPLHLLARVIQSGESLKTNYGTGGIIHDGRNRLGHLLFKPALPSFGFNPASVLEAHPNLQTSDLLRIAWSSPGNLKLVVPDFPHRILKFEGERPRPPPDPGR